MSLFTKIFGKFFTPTDSVLFILRQVVSQKNKKVQKPMSIENQVFFVFANRMIIDAESALLLSKKGYYGSASSLVAIMFRNEAMYASLVSDKARLNDFWNEERSTYQDDKNFSTKFNESATRQVAQKEFGKDAFQKADLEKLLHGSCYAIRKAYSQRKMGKDGKTYPLITMGRFLDKNKKTIVELLVRGALLDFLGVFLPITKRERKLLIKKNTISIMLLLQKPRMIYLKKKTRVRDLTNSKYSTNALDCIFHMPIFNTLQFKEISKIPQGSTGRILNDLVEGNVLKVLQQGSGQRPTLYIFPKLLDIVDN